MKFNLKYSRRQWCVFHNRRFAALVRSSGFFKTILVDGVEYLNSTGGRLHGLGGSGPTPTALGILTSLMSCIRWQPCMHGGRHFFYTLKTGASLNLERPPPRFTSCPGLEESASCQGKSAQLSLEWGHLDMVKVGTTARNIFHIGNTNPAGCNPPPMSRRSMPRGSCCPDTSTLVE